MPYPKGRPRPLNAGRKKGSLNKKDQAVIDHAYALGIDPLEVLLHICANNWKALGYDSPTRTVYTSHGIPMQIPHIQLEHRLLAAKEATQYIHAKRRDVQVSGEIETKVSASINVTEVKTMISKLVATDEGLAALELLSKQDEPKTD